MKLYFTADAYFNGIHKYKKGETYEISNELGEANRWLKRGAVEIEVVVAEVVIEEVPVEILAEISEVLVEEIEEVVVKEQPKKENKKSKKAKD